MGHPNYMYDMLDMEETNYKAEFHKMWNQWRECKEEYDKLRIKADYWNLAYTEAVGVDIEREQVFLAEIAKLRKLETITWYEVYWGEPCSMPSSKENVLVAWYHPKTKCQSVGLGYWDAGQWHALPTGEEEWPKWIVSHWSPLPEFPEQPKLQKASRRDFSKNANGSASSARRK